MKKIYKVRIDKDEGYLGYQKNVDSVNLIGENIEEVIAKAGKYLGNDQSYLVIGKITLIAILNEAE